jgi:single-stranded-DNA-specific exonuclease
MVELLDENRIMAFWGLIQFNEAPRLSLEVLRAQSKRRLPFNIRDIVFSIGPVLNAAGRMEHGREAVKMMLANTRVTAETQAEFLALKNQERRELQQEIIAEAEAIIGDDPSFHDKRCTVVYRPHWHQGVIGVVAAKLAEKYHRPTIVLTKSKKHLVGSARSIGDFDIHQAIADSGQLLLNFGGHKYAAGLSLEEKNLEDFSLAFEDFVYHSLTTDNELPTLFIDAQLEMKHINDKFWNILRQFAPFGPGNSQPVFMSKMVKDTGYSKLIKEEHIKLLVRQGDSEPLEGIAYGFGDQFEQLSSRKPFHLCYAIEQQVYMGRKSLQLLVRDIKF